MPTEKLLTITQTATKFGLERRSIERHLAELKAKGLQIVRAGRKQLVREASADALIKRLSDREDVLF